MTKKQKKMTLLGSKQHINGGQEERKRRDAIVKKYLQTIYTCVNQRAEEERTEPTRLEGRIQQDNGILTGRGDTMGEGSGGDRKENGVKEKEPEKSSRGKKARRRRETTGRF